MKLLQEYNRLIQAARVYEILEQTPLEKMNGFSDKIGTNVYLKREDLLPIFSFKLRGSYNMIAHLSAAQKKQGIITASAGNHAQGVARTCRLLGIKATIAMPETTTSTKLQAVRSYGAKVALRGDAFKDAFNYAQELKEKKGYIYIPPFNNPYIIAGQGTIGAEILRQSMDKIDAIFVPVGGGGLISGIGAYVKYINPSIKIIGVEPEGAASMSLAFKKGRPTPLKEIDIFADGVAVDQVGVECFKLAKICIDQMITVSNDEICAATKDIHEDTRVLSEPSGAVALAGLRKYCENGKSKKGQNMISILSGANTDFNRLRYIAERTEIGEQKEGLFVVTIPERPGSFLQLCKLLGKYDITAFNYRYSHDRDAKIFIGVRIKSKDDIRSILRSLKTQKYPAHDITDNEVAKEHIKYMVGGMNNVKDEKIYRFEFPERPGALLRFLNKVKSEWNISLFNYRDHGSAYSTVLAGFQTPDKERKILERYLDDIGYVFYPETDNIAYQSFLRPQENQ